MERWEDFYKQISDIQCFADNFVVFVAYFEDTF